MQNYERKYWERLWDNCFATRDDQVDAFGRPISFEEYGKDVEKGWELDHIWPANPEDKEKLHGSNNLSNFQPLNWQSNLEKKNDLFGRVNNLSFVIRQKAIYDKKIIGIMKVEGYEKYPYERWQ